jgi:hypothetical protein
MLSRTGYVLSIATRRADQGRMSQDHRLKINTHPVQVVRTQTSFLYQSKQPSLSGTNGKDYNDLKKYLDNRKQDLWQQHNKGFRQDIAYVIVVISSPPE